MTHASIHSEAALPAAARPTHFRLLPDQSTVRFATRHLFGLASVTGTVRIVSGRMIADLSTASLLLLEAELDMGSFESANVARDRVVASPKFLDSVSFPTAVFLSTSATRVAEGWLVHGTLTVKGRAVPMELVVGEVELGTASEVKATARLDRFAFGITIPTVLAARHLRVDIDARGERITAA